MAQFLIHNISINLLKPLHPPHPAAHTLLCVGRRGSRGGEASWALLARVGPRHVRVRPRRASKASLPFLCTHGVGERAGRAVDAVRQVVVALCIQEGSLQQPKPIKRCVKQMNARTFSPWDTSGTAAPNRARSRCRRAPCRNSYTCFRARLQTPQSTFLVRTSNRCWDC